MERKRMFSERRGIVSRELAWGKCEVSPFPSRITENLAPSEALLLKAKEPSEDEFFQALLCISTARLAYSVCEPADFTST